MAGNRMVLIGNMTLCDGEQWSGTLSDDMTFQSGTFAGDSSGDEVIQWAAWSPYARDVEADS